MLGFKQYFLERIKSCNEALEKNEYSWVFSMHTSSFISKNSKTIARLAHHTFSWTNKLSKEDIQLKKSRTMTETINLGYFWLELKNGG